MSFQQLPVCDERDLWVFEAPVGPLDATVNGFLVAIVHEALVGRLLLAGNAHMLNGPWTRVRRVQTAHEYRGIGTVGALTAEVERAARDDCSLDQLHLELRGGVGLERSLEHCGWLEIGRWPQGLRLGHDDFRDEARLHLPLARP